MCAAREKARFNLTFLASDGVLRLVPIGVLSGRGLNGKRRKIDFADAAKMLCYPVLLDPAFRGVGNVP